MKTIRLTKGYIAFVDDEDYERVSKHIWYPSKNGLRVYAITDISERTVYMHRFIMGVDKPSVDVDHRYGNGLNNQRYNLRIATRSQNMGNLKKTTISKSSKFKGVTWDKENSKWYAKITFDYKTKNLGRFLSEEEAALAYDVAAHKYFGEFSLTNFGGK